MKTAIALCFVWAAYVGKAAQLAQSTDDLWDVSHGTVITGQSPIGHCCCPSTNTPFDARDLFGGSFSPPCDVESQVVVFADGNPDGFVHFVQWATPNPVTIRSFNLWAAGDAAPAVGQREMKSFRLLAKSPGSSTFDLILYTFTPSHPYTYVDGIPWLLVSTDIKPVTAREFRAEFVNRGVPAGQCCDAPRV